MAGVRGAWGVQRDVTAAANITVFGTVPHQSMPRRVWANTRLLLSPSISEAWGKAAVEAISNSIPVIAHPTPGLVESMGVDGAEVFIDRDDPHAWAAEIRRLFTDADYWAARSTAAFTRARLLETGISADIEGFVHFVEESARASSVKLGGWITDFRSCEFGFGACKWRYSDFDLPTEWGAFKVFGRRERREQERRDSYVAEREDSARTVFADLVSEVERTTKTSNLNSQEADALKAFLSEVATADWGMVEYFEFLPGVTESMKHKFDFAQNQAPSRLDTISNQSNRQVVALENGLVDKSRAQQHARTQLASSLASWFELSNVDAVDAALVSACAWRILQATYNSSGDLFEQARTAGRTKNTCFALLAFWGTSVQREQLN